MRRISAAAGIDVGGTYAKVGIVSASGRLLREETVATHPARGPRDFVKRMAALLGSWRRAGAVFSAAGLAVAGDVDSERGSGRGSPNLRGWNGFKLRDELARALRLPVVMAKDANLALWGDYRTELAGKTRNVVG